MTPAELRALVAKATVQPWATNGSRVECRDDHGWVNDGWIIGDLEGPDAEANAALIVAAVNALPALLDRLEAAERGAEKWRAYEERKRKVIAASMGRNPLRADAALAGK